MKEVDYSLYLVTDSGMLPEGTTLESQVTAALVNGATLVQLREKDADAGDFVEIALRIKRICAEFDVPLLINDRVDVALAVDADGVHVGQQDIPPPLVRKMMGPGKIIGWSVGRPEEVLQLAKWGPGCVDYIGVGMVFPTETKKNPRKSPMGIAGAVRIMDALEESRAAWCRSVLIGGLHLDNIGRLLLQCASSNGKRAADGVAVVSEIMAATDAGSATQRLRRLLDDGAHRFIVAKFTEDIDYRTPEHLLPCVLRVREASPLVHHVTNKVHQNFAANITLAASSSPIMSEIPSEFEDLSSASHSALVLNTGSLVDIGIATAAVRAYNAARRPIVLDPVGFSASRTRLEYNGQLLNIGQYSCIKGNASEILALSSPEYSNMRGVDSAHHEDISVLCTAARRVAYRYRTVVVLTGHHDIIANGALDCSFSLGVGSVPLPEQLPAYIVSCDSIPTFSKVTATGCSLGSVIACFLGALPPDGSPFHAVISAVLIYKSAGVFAADRATGGGSFQAELLDSMNKLFENSSAEQIDAICPLESWPVKVKRVDTP
ncbi:AaceriAFL110Cp [[Ashbya] aceris (nom. inval.)]|nr:AaceriAFL110Cp [[Ashbya] aceris (nom. inval.)]